MSELTPEATSELRAWAERFDDEYARDALAEIDRLRAVLADRDRHLTELRADAEEITRIAHTAINELMRANRIQDSARLRIALFRYQAKYLPPTAKEEPRGPQE